MTKLSINKLACLADDSKVAQDAKLALEKYHKFCPPEKAQAMVVLGGDGFMLHCLHEYMDYNIPFYGMNCGTVGFLLNEFREENLIEIENKAIRLTDIPKLQRIARSEYTSGC